MRIISTFHDYYDSVQRQGQDLTLIYLRNKKTVSKMCDFPQPHFCNLRGKWWRAVRQKMRWDVRVIGFCGKVYPVLLLYINFTDEPTYCYSVSDVDDFVKSHFKRKDVRGYEYKSKKYTDSINGWSPSQQRHLFEEFFEDWAGKQEDHEDLFDGQPIFVVTRPKRQQKHKIVYNECLKDYEFFRIFETYTAYQEIAMYLGSLAQPNKPIPEIPDKIMVEVKGFDGKLSFRKPPGKKKRKGK